MKGSPNPQGRRHFGDRQNEPYEKLCRQKLFCLETCMWCLGAMWTLLKLKVPWVLVHRSSLLGCLCWMLASIQAL